jgi:hypothetical protein
MFEKIFMNLNFSVYFTFILLLLQTCEEYKTSLAAKDVNIDEMQKQLANVQNVVNINRVI